jgi:hypothetical protein
LGQPYKLCGDEGQRPTSLKQRGDWHCQTKPADAIRDLNNITLPVTPTTGHKLPAGTPTLLIDKS